MLDDGFGIWVLEFGVGLGGLLLSVGCWCWVIGFRFECCFGCWCCALVAVMSDGCWALADWVEGLVWALGARDGCWGSVLGVRVWVLGVGIGCWSRAFSTGCWVLSVVIRCWVLGSGAGIVVECVEVGGMV